MVYYARHEALLRQHQQQYAGPATAAAATAAAPPSTQAAAPAPAPAPSSFRLVMKEGAGAQPGKEWTLPVGTDHLIGRNSRECQIVLKDVWVSAAPSFRL